MYDIVGMSEAPFSASEEIQEHPGKLWTGQFSWQFFTRAEAANYVAWLAALRGKVGTFTMGDPLGQSPRGSALGSPEVNGASQSGLQLVTDGWTASESGLLLRGDYIQLGSASLPRLYMVTQDVSSDGSGNATIDIWPNLRESPSDNEPLVLEGTKGTFRLASNARDIAVEPPYNYGIGVSFREAINA